MDDLSHDPGRADDVPSGGAVLVGRGDIVDADLSGEVYDQSSIRRRLEAAFLAHVGQVLLTSQLEEVARDPDTGRVPRRWHQRVNELRSDGYTIWTANHRDWLQVRVADDGRRDYEYLMPTADRVKRSSKPESDGSRVKPSSACWELLLERAGGGCEWDDDGRACGLGHGAPHPDGGTVQLTADHLRPHSQDPDADADDPDVWRVLCHHHQMRKRHYWDNTTGKLRTLVALADASRATKQQALLDMADFHGVGRTVQLLEEHFGVQLGGPAND